MKTRAYTSLRATIPVAVTAAVLTIAGLLHAETNLANTVGYFTKPMQVRLAYSDQNGNAKDFAFQQLPASLLELLPLPTPPPTPLPPCAPPAPSMHNLAGCPAPGSGASALIEQPVPDGQAPPPAYFDAVWSNIRSAVCGDIQAQVTNRLNGDYTAYNFKCQTAPNGLLSAHIQNSWKDNFDFTVTGTRLLTDYTVPANAISFYVTTPSTCSKSSVTCQQDPQFSVSFDVELAVFADSVGESSLVLPPAVSGGATVTLQSITSGDQTQAIIDAWQQFMLNYDTSGDPSPEELGKDFLQFLVNLADIGITDFINQDVRDLVSASLGALISNTASTSAVTAAKDFEYLYSDLQTAEPFGFNTLSVSGGDDNSLIFRLIYPAPGMPGVYNKLAQVNSMPSIIAPSISLSLPQVAQGGKVQVLGSNFPAAYSDLLVISWGHTVLGPSPQTEIQWGPAGVPVTTNTTSQFQLEFDNLKAATTYTFQVHECDAVSCAPWSNPFSTGTLAGNQVSFHLDTSPLTVIGTATQGTDGSFAGTATIPLNTPTGTHTLTAIANGAAVGSTAEVSTQIVVCSASGCSPSFGVVGDNGGIQSSGSAVLILGSVTVKGANFLPGKTVDVSIDGFPSGSLLTGLVTSATVGSDGTFETSFQMPNVSQGSHTLYATEILSSHTVSHPGPLGPITTTVIDQTLQTSTSILAEALR